MMIGDSIGSSQIQLANIFDIQGNALLVNEYVIMDGSYVFQRFDPAIYLLIGASKIHDLSFINYELSVFTTKSIYF